MREAPAAMPSDNVARHQNPLRWGWGPSAIEKRLISRLALTALLVLALAVPALAGPPFICHPFDIGAAKSLPWGAGNNYLAMRDDYDFHNVVADTERLLWGMPVATPTLVRMETLRRAAIYASRDRAIAEQLLNSVTMRVHAADPGTQASALFDAGYVIEAFNELREAAVYWKQLAGLELTLAGLTNPNEARPMIEKAASLRPGDASIEFALGLLSRAPESEKHFDKARAGSRQDTMLANNLARFQLQ